MNYKYLLYSIVSIILFVVISYIGSYSFALKICLGTITYFFTTWFFTNRDKWIAIIFLVPIILINVSLHVIDFGNTMIGLPSTVFLLIASLLGCLSKKRKTVWPLVVLIALILGYTVFFQKLWFNKLNYGSFTQERSRELTAFTLLDRKYDTVTQKNIAGVTLMDFWNSHCGPCYKEFPFVDSLYSTLRENNISFYSVNVPMRKEKMGENFDRLDKYGYRFPVLFASTEHIIDTFGVKVFPTTIVIADSKILFQGNFKEAYEYALTLKR